MSKLCPKCETNYINDDEESCVICKRKTRENGGKKDDNKQEVEKYLLPYLRALSENDVESLTHKKMSFELFKLRLPLLVKCQENGADCCRNEIKDKAGHNRYYSTPYVIGNGKYHICSQWWSSTQEHSKDLLKNLYKLELHD